MIVLAVRRPEGFLHPNLWAEDGPIFLRSAYLDPWYRSVWHPYNGYLHLVLRLWAEATTMLPPSALAASYTVLNLALFPLCCSVVLSRRMRWLIPSDAARAALFVALLLLPGTSETVGNLTNALWPIAIGLVLLSFCDSPRTRGGRVAELLALALGGLTGAASLLLWPAYGLRWWRERVRHNLVAFGVVLATAAIQGALVLTHPRPDLGLDPAVRTIPRAVGLRVWGLLLLGERTLAEHVLGHPASLPVLALCAVGVATTIAALIALPRIVRLHISLVFVLSLAATAWAYSFNMRSMGESSAHGRYFIVPAALVVLAVFAAASTVTTRQRVRALMLTPVALFFAFAVVADFALPELAPTYWARTAACIRTRQPCEVRVNPTGLSFVLPPVG